MEQNSLSPYLLGQVNKLTEQKDLRLPQNKNIRFLFDGTNLSVFSFCKGKINWELKISKSDFYLAVLDNNYPDLNYFKELLKIKWPNRKHRIFAKKLVKEKGGVDKLEIRKMETKRERQQNFIKGLSKKFSVSQTNPDIVDKLLFRTEYLLSDSEKIATEIGPSDLLSTACFYFKGDKVHLRFFY